MGFIAAKEQIILRDGKHIKVKAGDPLPEAATWSRSWFRTGFVEYVEDQPKAPVQASPAKEEPAQVVQSAPAEQLTSEHLWGTRELRKKTKAELVGLAGRYGIAARPLKRDDIIRRIREAQGAVQ